LQNDEFSIELKKYMADIIKHTGVVERIDGPHITVRIVQTSACAACSVKGHCHASDSKEKTVDVYSSRHASFQVGERVVVCGTTSMGMRAVFIAFGIPFFVLVGALFAAMQMTGSEWQAGLIALAALVPYYLIIYMCKDKLGRKFTFTIESNEPTKIIN
jgi:sigma-E factor negative regulatory protein RseC